MYVCVACACFCQYEKEETESKPSGYLERLNTEAINHVHFVYVDGIIQQRTMDISGRYSVLVCNQDIYIYIERERERERECDVFVCDEYMCVCVCVSHTSKHSR
jgi:hypothetical protein